MEVQNIQGTEKEEAVPPLRIMLLGKSGAGKSSSGNTILGKKEFKTEMKLQVVTDRCKMDEGKIDDVGVTVIDTPGLFTTDCKQNETMREILMFLRRNEPGPHVFVLVVPLGRMTLEDEDINTLIEQNLGPRVWDYTIVLFTHGDNLGGKTIKEVITGSDDNQRAFIRKCSGAFHVFNNKEQEDQKQVTKFLKRIQTVLALNGGGRYHKDLYPRQQQKIWERQAGLMRRRNNRITHEEGKLQDKFQGQELEEEKRELWRKEAEKAWGDAENWYSSFFGLR